MRISEAAQRLGMSPRMLRYREELGLLPLVRGRDTVRDRRTPDPACLPSSTHSSGPAHRQYTEEDLATIAAALRLEQRYDITPAALAFGLRVLTESSVRAAVADLGRRTGHVPATPGRALDFEKERALRWLGAPSAKR
jgi:hypothetical protein